MQGDFTRLTFDPTKNYSRVLMQQGRVQIDADGNEAAEIQLYLLRALAADLIGPHGGPKGDSFKIGVAKVDSDRSGQEVPRDFQISAGRYYVDGILCESRGRRFSEQTGFDKDSFGDLGGERARDCLVYLDVCERHVTYLEDEDENRIGIREVALRGLDTTTRAQVICQVRCQDADRTDQAFVTAYGAFVQSNDYVDFLNVLAVLGRPRFGGGRLRARANPPAVADTPCTIAPEARYRGAENQLYRVEIHEGGKLGEATFKWSRENGSVVFPVKNAADKVITLASFGRDERLGLHPDGWVELVDDDYILRQRIEPLLEIEELMADDLIVQLKTSIAANVGGDRTKHPLLRRWDSPGLVTVAMDATKNGGWLPLEDGIEIKFDAGPNDIFRSGDYWLIPARVATGDVEWPGPSDNPLPLPPHGVEHHYAPLAIISLAADGKVTVKNELRRTWTPLAV